ncbi:phage late control gene D protein Gpd [Clostridium saccharobutylicum]|uniref:phage tail protein n=1 Tax=Clostridium saccharobutylicum TaxID=169679 RepID=UPI000983A0B0|nr:phage tail protein [Clostridium saccharobutylicum]AQS08744.1 phage late control gene D protein Gpd [Clostridium saccharobutylicum]MBC2438741.1 phage tail protein [Clostridium saccharobutylicum]NSB91026.1 hypothetical protein [Clostridium saccharobutylicum]NYC28909.1 hypothetical protein [Clostridium saccharobutylicum]OOM18380.1 phage late control protein Gpd [Clostridium saccharobutylicum]
MRSGYTYTQGDILVEPYAFIKILDLKIDRKINEHAKIYISGIISDEDSDKYVEVADDDESIKVSVKDDNNNIIDLFQGMVTNIAINSINDVKTLEIEALSHTFEMDIEKKYRSFQGENLTYADIFNKVNKDYSNLQMREYIPIGQTIDKIIVQYNETDWEFIKRLASHFNVGVIPECRLSGIKFSIGKGESEACNLEEFNYSINKGLKEYKIKSKNSNLGLIDTDLISYEIITNKILDLYNSVNFKNRNLNVYKSETSIVNRVISTKYTLRDEKGMKVRRIYNDKLVGASLDGKILNTKADVVKISLKIDGYPGSQENAVWLPYSTVFSSQDGTGWYCMPEIGDAIRMYFPDNDEKNTYAISSVNLKASNPAKRSDPSVKSIGTKYGKEIIMKPGAVEVMANGSLFMKLTDSGGIEIKSDNKITLDAKKDIEINGENIKIEGKTAVDLVSGAGATVTINEDVTASGAKINTQ